jgi:NADPH2:quinone reductase
VRPPCPYTPGCEIAGEVAAVGEGSDFVPGDRVVSQPKWGAFAEYVLVENPQTNRVPDDIDLRRAATIPVVYPTAHVTLGRRAGLQPGEFLLVTAGAGGVGLAAVQIGRAWGARVIALAGSEEKCAVCRDHGAELALNYRDEGWVDAVMAHTDGQGCAVIYDPVGGDTFNTALKAIAFEGRAMIVGFAGGSIQQIAANRLLLKNASAMGAIWGAYYVRAPAQGHAIVADCFAMLRDGRIDPVISAEFPLDQVPDALERLYERRTVGKVIVRVAG